MAAVLLSRLSCVAPALQIGVDTLARQSRRTIALEPFVHDPSRYQRPVAGGEDGTVSAAAKHALIDNLLGTSPPLPAPPAMQPAQIVAQERELELLMSKMTTTAVALPAAAVTTAAAPHRAITIDPAFAVVAPPPAPAAAPQSSLTAQLKARPVASAATGSGAPAFDAADMFAKVAVAPRPPPAASSFVPSSLSAALTDSGVLFRQQAMGRPGNDDYARVSVRGGGPAGNDRGRNASDNDALRRPLNLTIYLHPYSDVPVRPVRIRLQIPAPPGDGSQLVSATTSHPVFNPSVDEVVTNLLQKWTTGELRANFGLRGVLQPALATATKWQLKMVDEDTVPSDDDSDTEDDEDELAGEGRIAVSRDEQVGVPEPDLPPLERPKPVRLFAVNTLAMVLAERCEHRMADCNPPETPPSTNRAVAPPPTSQQPPSPVAPNTTASGRSTPPPPPPPSTAAPATSAVGAPHVSIAPPPLPPSVRAMSASVSVSGPTGLASPSSRNPSASMAVPHSEHPPNLNRYQSLHIGPPPQHRATRSISPQPAQPPSPNTPGSAGGSGSGLPQRAKRVSVFGQLDTPASGASTGASTAAPSGHHTRSASLADPHMIHRASISSTAGGINLPPSALIAPSGASGPAAQTTPTGASAKFYLKVHIGDHESHVLGMLKSQTLADALPLLSAKKNASVPMKPAQYRFTYVDPLLRAKNDDLRDCASVLIANLQSDELNLTPILGGGVDGPSALTQKTPSPFDSNESAAASSGVAASFQFSLETASAYCEYRVIKTNQRGKRQHRIFGMDRYKIYNKVPGGGSDEGDSAGGGGNTNRVFSFIQRFSMGGEGAGGGGLGSGVSRAYRMINTIASVHVVSLRPTCFCIAFRADARKDSPVVQSREYETETKLECAEVVAKLQFLMKHATPNDPTTGGATK